MTDDEYNTLMDRLESRNAPHPQNISVYPEWAEVIDMLDRGLYALDPGYTLVQAKGKFGGLRYYFAPSVRTNDETSAKMRELVRIAEVMCDFIESTRLPA